MKFNHIYQGDCLEVMKQFPDKCIDLVITSPPYFNLRDYGADGQVGHEKDSDEYIDKLICIFNEVQRILKDEGSCFVNIDDVYSEQSLSCIPDKFKIRMVESGWLCRNEIIWHKPNAMPSSAKTRFNNDYEKMFFFVKKKKYAFTTQYEPLRSTVVKNAQVGKSKAASKYENTEQESSVRQGMNKARGSKIIALRKNLPSQKEFVEFIRSRTTIDDIVENSDLKRSKVEHWFRRDEGGFSFPSVEDWNGIKWMLNDWSKEFQDIDDKLIDITYETDDILKNAHKGRIKRAVWSINTKPFKGCHYAPFPEELVKTPILACTQDGGIVLDPFVGSGTTCAVAKTLNRNYIGIDLNESFVDIAVKRIAEVRKAVTTNVK